MTSKQRAYLRGLANNIDAIFQVGKSGISDVLLEQLDKALEIAKGTNSVVVQTVGSKITLFRQREKDSKIEF